MLALEHELFPEDPWTAQMFADEVAQPPEIRLYLVAEADAARRSGRTSHGAAPARHGRVRGDAVRPRRPAGRRADDRGPRVRWGLGIGSALLGALIEAARERDCAEVFLEVRADNPRAHGLYQRRGFEEIGVRRGYYKPSGVDAIVMRKDLLR